MTRREQVAIHHLSVDLLCACLHTCSLLCSKVKRRGVELRSVSSSPEERAAMALEQCGGGSLPLSLPRGFL